jgi:beta-glucosidase
MAQSPAGSFRRTQLVSLVTLAAVVASAFTLAAQAQQAPVQPWMNPSLSLDQRARLVIKAMTLDEKIGLVTGYLGYPTFRNLQAPAGSLGADGFIFGIPPLGIPAQQEIGSGLGVTNLGKRPHGVSTAFPSGIAQAATWDPELAYQTGAVIGRETRQQGFNVHLGTGVNLAREPRGGRTFEWMGEDPLLAGKLAAAKLRGIQSQGVISTSHIFAMNDQEGGRMFANSIIDPRAMRESDLLAFEFAITESDVGAVMCSYNLVNGIYACQNKFLLTDVLRRDWGFKGYVKSDWGAVHNTVAAAMAGLDQESGNPYKPGKAVADRNFGIYGSKLKEAVEKGQVPKEQLNGMVEHIVRTMFVRGVIDHPPRVEPVDLADGGAVSQRVAEESAVLLKNAGRQLPLSRDLRSITVIGSHADVGVPAGGGSSLVYPPGGNAVPAQVPPNPFWDASSPMKAIEDKLPRAEVRFDPGTDIPSAARLAASSQVAIVFANQWMGENRDMPNLSLPGDQDALIAQVAAANPHTIVILETGGPVLMPWADQVAGILEVWYPGSRGGPAIANILFGDANPEGRLPITFPRSEGDLPHPVLPHPPSAPQGAAQDVAYPVFDIHYDEGVNVGYKWYDAEGKTPLFPFGFGLSYTRFGYSNLQVSAGNDVVVSFDVTDTGTLAGGESAQVYVELPESASEPPKRLAGWKKLKLHPGETGHVQLTIDPRMLAIFDVDANNWHVLPGQYRFFVGPSSRDLPLKATLTVEEARVKP